MPVLQPLSAGRLAVLEMNHQGLLDLCLKIEELSASFPDEIEAATCDEVTKSLLPLLKQTQQLEEQTLFERCAAAPIFGIRFAQELKAEHRCDLATAADALSVVRSIREDAASIEPARHLLRGFSDALRRHILSEKLMIEVFLATEAENGSILSPDDRAL